MKNTTTEKKKLRFFGLLIGGVFLVIAVWPLLFQGVEIRRWGLILAALFLGLAVVLPEFLGPIYRLWMRVGHFLGKINTKIIMGFVFYVVITPISQFLRISGKTPICTKFDSSAESYRVPKAQRPGSDMEKQF